MFKAESTEGQVVCGVGVTIRLRDDMPQPTHLNLTGWCGQHKPVLPLTRDFDTQGRSRRRGTGASLRQQLSTALTGQDSTNLITN